MPRIFISYRRADSATITGRIYDRLVTAFGEENIFKDVDDIPVGVDFRSFIKHEVDICDVMLVIIGQKWSKAASPEGHNRLHDPGDFVRIEVESGLERENVLVVPVLVQNAVMPDPADLPPSLVSLIYRNAAMVRDDPDFNRDISRLVEQLRRSFPSTPASKFEGVSPARSSWRMVFSVVTLVGFLAVALLLTLNNNFSNPSVTSTPTEENVTVSSMPQLTLLVTTQTGIRMRESPDDGLPIRALRNAELVVSLETAEETLRKVGVVGEWVRISTLEGEVGFFEAQFLQEAPQRTHVPLGVYVDPNHLLGHPSASELGNLDWVRIKFNLSYNPTDATYGNTDLDEAFARYDPVLTEYSEAGIKVMLVFTHQLYGEGAGFNWSQMSSTDWDRLTEQFADYASLVADHYAGSNRVHAYQIWNEQDVREARSSVFVPPENYAHLLAETIEKIRQVDNTTPIITGGHVTGPDAGSAYARTVLAAMPADVRPDGIAFHPYGRGELGNRFSNFGSLEEEILQYAEVMPGKQVWITEWGVLDVQGNTSLTNDVVDYARGFITVIEVQFADQVAASIWYAWADGMDNGYGLVDSTGQPKPNLHENFVIGFEN